MKTLLTILLILAACKLPVKTEEMHAVWYEFDSVYTFKIEFAKDTTVNYYTKTGAVRTAKIHKTQFDDIVEFYRYYKMCQFIRKLDSLHIQEIDDQKPKFLYQ